MVKKCIIQPKNSYFYVSPAVSRVDTKGSLLSRLSVCLSVCYAFPVTLLYFAITRVLLILLKLNFIYMDRPWWEEVPCRRSLTLASIFLELFPFVTFSSLDNSSCFTSTIGIKLHVWLDLMIGSDMHKVHNSGIAIFMPPSGRAYSNRTVRPSISQSVSLSVCLSVS